MTKASAVSIKYACVFTKLIFADVRRAIVVSMTLGGRFIDVFGTQNIQKLKITI